MRSALAALLLLVPALAAGCIEEEGDDGTTSAPAGSCAEMKRGDLQLSSPAHTVVAIDTSKGCIVAELYDEKAPITVANFKTYVQEGFYSNLLFHRVIEDFMIQTGGVKPDGSQKAATHPAIQNEAKTSGLLNLIYTLAMARTNAPNSATSQFFINVKDNPSLNPGGVSPDGYAVFGIVVSGPDVVDAIKKVPVQRCSYSEACPLEQVLLKSAQVIE